MKWIGQHIYDQISRFRDDVYLEDISSGTIASGGHLGLDSNNKIVKATDGGGDLTAIVAGTGLSGSSLTGPIPTLNVDAAQTGITSLGTLSSLAVTSASDLGSAAIALINQDADQIALNISASNTTANVMQIASETLSTGNVISMSCTGLTTGGGLYMNIDDALTDSNTRRLVNIDYDKSGVTAASAGSTTTGLVVDMADAATNHASGAVSMTGAQINIDSANAQGTITQKGLVLSVAGDGVGDAATTFGIDMTVLNGGTDIKMTSHLSQADYCTIQTTTSGATTLTTVDGSAAAAHFEIAADGNIVLDAAGDIALEAGGDDITLDSDDLVITSSTSQKPRVDIIDTADDADGSRFRFVKNRGAAGEDDDLITAVQFKGYNDAGTPEETTFAQIIANIHDATDGQESGKLSLQVANHDGGIGSGLILTGGSANDEIDVTVGLGASSVTTIAGILASSYHTINSSRNECLTLNTDGDASGSPFITFQQNGTRRAFIQLNDTNNNFRLASEYGKVEISAASTDGSDSDTAYLQIAPTGIFRFGAEDNDAVLTADGNMTFRIDADNDETGQSFAFQNNASTEIANLNESGDLQVDGSIRGKQIEFIHCSFKDDQGTTETFLPLGSPPEEKTSFGNEQSILLMPCSGNVKEIIVRAHYNTYTSENIVFKIYKREAAKRVNGSSQVGSDITVAAPTQSTSAATNTRSTGEITHAYAAGDMLGISMTHQSTGPTTASDKTYVTVVVENDLNDLSY